MKPKQRWLILGSLLFATLLAGYLLEDEPLPEKGRRPVSATRTADSSPTAERRRTPVPELAAAPLSFPEPVAEENAPDKKVIDPFRSKSWFVAPPPPPKPPKPTAPPLPFKYLGKLKEGSETRVFLNHQGQHLIVKVGDTIAGVYSVEEISGGQMVLLYQPLKEKQVLSIGTDS